MLVQHEILSAVTALGVGMLLLLPEPTSEDRYYGIFYHAIRVIAGLTLILASLIVGFRIITAL